MRRMLILCAVGAVCLLPVSPIPASEGAIPIWQPTTITTPGKYLLTRDVTDSDSATIEITSVSDVHIDLNGFTIENTGTGSAISAFGSDRLQVRNGRLKGGGISAYACEDMTITGLTISDPSGNGISVDDSTAVISHNVISGAGGSGIYVLASEIAFVEVQIVNNVIRDPAFHGISMIDVVRSVVADNQVLNGIYGIQYYGSEGGELRRNTIHGSDTGIYIVGSDGAHVYRNIVRECSTTGIYLEHSDFNHIEANVLSGNGTGLHFDSNAEENIYRGNSARGNTIADFVDSGIGNSSHRDNYMPNQI